jgi:8-oxo-dGTP diphosphatase
MNQQQRDKQIVMGALCYVIHKDCVLLALRRKPPHVGFWSAPGGKIEFGETPEICAVRELKEETGLSIKSPVLRGLSSVYDATGPFHWIVFIYSAENPMGELNCNSEDLAQWIPLKELHLYSMPDSDEKYLELILENAPFFQIESILNSGNDVLNITCNQYL